MGASLFILLPEGNAVLDIPQTKEALGGLFAPLMRVKEFARMQGINLRVFFDQENIIRFKTDVGQLVDDGTYLDKPITILRSFVRSHSTDVNKELLIDADCSYIRWDTITCTADADAPLIVKSSFESPGAPCVLSLSPKMPTDYNKVSLIKDSAYCESLPELKNIPLFFSADECIEWLSSLLEGHFSLMGNNAFTPTTYHWNNQRIYEKVADRTYWYFDFFHRENKIHYEVFNHEGDHLGEAAEDGVLVNGTVDHNKSIRHILHGN